jgi:hypothetical protein
MNPPKPRRRSTRQGKIARLPYDVRMQVNRRLLDGQTGAEILSWLNALPAVQDRLQKLWKGRPISEQNLSEWRMGGYQDWLKGNPSFVSLASLSARLGLN